MVHTSSLLSLAAAAVGASLAWFTLQRPRPRSRRQTFFAGLNIGSTLWALGTFVLMNNAPGREAGTFGYSDPGYYISIVIAVGVAVTTLFWFLFAAEHAGKRAWTRPPIAWIAAVPGVYTVLASATNPSHRLMVTQGAAFDSIKVGPLGYPYLIGIYALSVTGIYLLIVGSWTRGTAGGRRQAVILGVVSLLATVAGLVWQLREFVPVDPTLNPIPVIMAMIELVLVQEVVTGGLADLLPHARATAFDAMHDAAIVLDTRMRIATVNRAAAKIFPMVEEGMPIAEYFSTLGLHARSCIERHPEGISFEIELGDSVYWGRARRLEGQQSGCLILLTDLTDLRLAQTELIRLGVEPGAKTPHVVATGPRERDHQ